MRARLGPRGDPGPAPSAEAQPDLVARAAHDGGEHGPGRVVAGEASFHQAGAVVAHEGGGLVFVAHGVWFLRGQKGRGDAGRVGSGGPATERPAAGGTDGHAQPRRAHQTGGSGQGRPPAALSGPGCAEPGRGTQVAPTPGISPARGLGAQRPRRPCAFAAGGARRQRPPAPGRAAPREDEARYPSPGAGEGGGSWWEGPRCPVPGGTAPHVPDSAPSALRHLGAERGSPGQAAPWLWRSAGRNLLWGR